MMPQTKNCDLCSREHSCSDVYEHLGKTKGQSIGFGVFIAFFVPIVVFIISLTVFEKLSADITTASEKFKTAIIFLLSLTMTALVMLVIKLIKFNLKK